MLLVFAAVCTASRRAVLSTKPFIRPISNAALQTPPNLFALKTPDENDQARTWIEHFKSQKVPRNLVELTFSRSSGPGGQNVNKVNTKATLRCSIHAKWIPPWAKDALRRSSSYVASSQDILITSTVYRSQAQNIQDCLDKLQSLILSASSAALIKETSEEQKERVRKLRQVEDQRRKFEKDKRSSIKKSRQFKGSWD